MMMKRLETGFADADAALMAMERTQRNLALDRAVHDGMKRESFGEGARWFVLRVRRRAEARVKESVDGLGFRTWVPMTKATAKMARHGGNREIDRPVFDGFVFVELVSNNYAWTVLLKLDGVISVISKDDRPIPVPAQNFNALMTMEGAGVFRLERKARERARQLLQADFPIGSAVTIKDGPFAFFDAVIDGYVHTRHVRAMIYIFGRETAVDLEIDQIRRLT